MIDLSEYPEDRFSIFAWFDPQMYDPKLGYWKSMLTEEERDLQIKNYLKWQEETNKKVARNALWFDGGVT